MFLYKQVIIITVRSKSNITCTITFIFGLLSNFKTMKTSAVNNKGNNAGNCNILSIKFPFNNSITERWKPHIGQLMPNACL